MGIVEEEESPEGVDGPLETIRGDEVAEGRRRGVPWPKHAPPPESGIQDQWGLPSQKEGIHRHGGDVDQGNLEGDLDEGPRRDPDEGHQRDLDEGLRRDMDEGSRRDPDECPQRDLDESHRRDLDEGPRRDLDGGFRRALDEGFQRDLDEGPRRKLDEGPR